MIRIPNQNIETENCDISHQMLFQTPLFEIVVKDIDNKELAENVYKLKEIDNDGCKKSNNGGWHSAEFGMRIEKNQDNLRFFKPLLDKFEYILPILPFEPAIVSLENYCIWANINTKNSFNTRHNHPGCDLAGVYYVKVPEGDVGNIVFNDPRQVLSYGDQFITQRYVGGESTSRFPVEGNMYLFPPSLEHCVMPNKTDEDRISISFNLNLR